MELPEQAPESGDSAPPLRLGAAGRVEVAPDFATQADERFEAVCDELGILLARHVEPVSARVLPFGSEQLAMVQVLDASKDGPELHAATARGTSRAMAVADAAVSAVTGGQNVLAAALPSAVAEGKVRTAVVFGEGDAPVRWGLADDEARLAALYAVVPHLGSFTASTGPDTYRVLRLPGIGVALVSEGASAASWVEGWFAALLHATQFALRTQQTPTDLVATAPPAPEVDGDLTPARVLEQLEDECRRILAAAQDQAREIREAAERDAAGAVVHPPNDDVRDEHTAAPTTTSRSDADALLGDAERARAAILADAQREAASIRQSSTQESESLLADTRRTCEAMLKAARREAKSLRRDAKRLREEAARVREGLRRRRKRSDAARKERPSSGSDAYRVTLRDARRTADDLLHDSRRTADDLLRDAHRAADEMIRDASRIRQRLLDETTQVAPAHAGGADARTPQPPPSTASPDEARVAALALLGAAAESVSALSSLLRAASEPSGATPGDPRKDLPGLYYGA
jgi:cell division septum initiation protein DivIVA